MEWNNMSEARTDRKLLGTEQMKKEEGMNQASSSTEQKKTFIFGRFKGLQ
jgi:hypothetical protein